MASYCCTKIDKNQRQDRNRPLSWVEPRGVEPLTSWLQTIGATVSEGHWRRWAGRWQWLENTKRQGGCCTFVLHPRFPLTLTCQRVVHSTPGTSSVSAKLTYRRRAPSSA